jgi:phosphoglycerate dehydrogenase-like enzyme
MQTGWGNLMKYRGAIIDDYAEVSGQAADWSLIPEVEFQTHTHPIPDTLKLIEALKGVSVLCLMRERSLISREVIEALPDLKIITSGGMRNAAIDVAAASERGIVVCGTSSIGYTPGELTIGLMLELSRRIGYEDRQMKAGVPWQTTAGTGLNGRTIGIIGLGKVGAHVAKVAKALDMNVVAWSQNLTEERCKEVGATKVTKVELLRQSDFVSIHVQLSPRTVGLIGTADLALMKPTAYLINTSRGQCVDEDALIAALRERKIAGAGLDVYNIEPLPLEHPFRKLDNVVATPHLGYATMDNYKVFYQGMVANIRAWLDGNPINQMKP